ncbi:MAG: LexA family transcriptional regulator, partial [Rubrivivax sp.]|nr:LexA family transcriptional regulator [Rubrivivax sp.]
DQLLAERMELGLSTVKNWHYRDSVRLEHLVRASADTSRSLDWLATGAESLFGASASRKMNLSPTASAGPGCSVVVAEEQGAPWRKAPPEDDARGRLPGRSPRGGADPRASALLLAAGTGDVRPLVLSLHSQVADRTLDYHVIPKVLGGAAAGRSGDTPVDRLDFDRAGDFALSHEWLYRHLQHTSGELASVQVMGDSMSPTLLDGDTIIIDRGVREVVADAIYVIHMLGTRLVKRIQRKSDGSLIIISDNVAYEREPVPRGRAGEIEVLGRMVWPRVR